MFTLDPPCPTERPPLLDANVKAPNALMNGFGVSPYLTRLARKRPDTIMELEQGNRLDSVERIIKRVRSLCNERNETVLMKSLRDAKADIHLALASLDLACEWDWTPVTEAYSRFADAAIEAALRAACRQGAEKGWLDWNEPSMPLPGLFIIAMGKLGAFELNYSSDVDLIALFDDDLFPSSTLSPGDAASRIIKAMTHILETPTADGYVLRVDLRLRPDPRSTPVAISTNAAEIYYESRGQNWERMAYIKARPNAGDLAAGQAFLDTLEPFIWRRHLDFWAIEDIRAIKQQIHNSGGHLDLTDAEFDVKLGRGGIREIEFFAQTQQLIHGGKDTTLRNPRTIETLNALATAGHIDFDTSDELHRAYGLLRGIEHRIQMQNDDHTHTLSGQDDARNQIAIMCGYDDIDRFDDDVHNLRIRVNTIFSDLFQATSQLSGIEGNLVFSGVDDDPGTLKTLSGLGLTNPKKVIADFQNWHRGGIRATRTPRGRQLLTALERRIFQLIAETGNPDTAFDGFRTFLDGLSAGVQTLSLLAANPAILKDLISIFSVAPKIAKSLSNRPELLESMLDGDFLADYADDACGHFAAIKAIPDEFAGDFEGAMNEVRRQFRDAHFRIRFKLLHDPHSWDHSPRAFSDLADICVQALEPAAIAAAEKSLGPAPGDWVICGLGKHGSRELTANSDLDLLVIYEGKGGYSDAPFYTRATQRLITAISAQTEEGQLYEADMQLRPSGRAGPVAVSIASFADYYRKEAWTWEHMALTRLRVVAGSSSLAAKVMAEKEALLSISRETDKIKADIVDMRERLLRERPAKHDFDLKLIKGGLIDIEFIVQGLQLLNPAQNWGERTIPDVLENAENSGLLTTVEYQTLSAQYNRISCVMTYQRVALDRPVIEAEWPDVLRRRTAIAADAGSFGDLVQAIQINRDAIWDIFCRKLKD